MKKFTIIITCTSTTEKKLEAETKRQAFAQAVACLDEWGIDDEDAVITVIQDDEVQVEQAPPLAEDTPAE